MLSVELKINGMLIYHIYARNVSSKDFGECNYLYEFYEIESREVKNGEVSHFRQDGLSKLVAKILEDMETRKNVTGNEDNCHK